MPEASRRALVGLFRAIAELSRYDAIKLLLRCQRQYAYLGFVIRNASFAHLQNCLVTMALYSLTVPAPALLFWASSLCTISVFIPIENPHLTIVPLEKLSGFTLSQPLTSVLCSNIKCVSEPCPNGFPYFPDASDLCSASRRCKTIFGSCFRT